jgi:hypothetical protein
LAVPAAALSLVLIFLETLLSLGRAIVVLAVWIVLIGLIRLLIGAFRIATALVLLAGFAATLVLLTALLLLVFLMLIFGVLTWPVLVVLIRHNVFLKKYSPDGLSARILATAMPAGNGAR